MQHKLSLAESELEKAESKVKELKAASDEGETHRTTGENLARKVQLLEEELDKAEKDLKETTEKYVVVHILVDDPDCRLRQVDVKAEHYERQVQRAEQERDEWERKHGVSSIKQGKSQADMSGSCGKVPAVQTGARRGRCSNGVTRAYPDSARTKLTV